MSETLTPPNIVIKLRKKEAAILIMLLDSGLINFENHRMVDELIFGKKNPNYAQLVEESMKIQRYIYDEIYKMSPEEIQKKVTDTKIKV
jgi:hypothetical protein